MADEKIVSELLEELSSMCELDRDTVAQLKPVLLKVIQRHLSALSGGAASSVDKKTKKGTGKRASTKSDKIPHKNGYHFFVAAKMGEVKDAGVGAKDRMKTIGEMWKKLTEADRVPFQDKAKTYNDSVDTEMKTTGWEARRETIVAAANQSAGAPPKKEPTKAAKATKPKPIEPVIEDDTGEADEDEGEVEVQKPASAAPAAAAPVAPVVAPTKAPEAAKAAPAEVAPVRRKKTTK
jgi:hypothetical protein